MRRAVWLGLVLVVSGCGVGVRPVDVNTLADTVATQAATRKSAHVAFDDAGTTGEGAYRTAPDLAADFSLTTPDGSSHLIVLDKAIYLRQPGQAWTRLPASSADLAASLTGQADIGRQLDRMRTAGRITGVAGEDVDGRPTLRYSIDLDVDRLADAERDTVVQSGLHELRKQGLTRIPYRLWLDADSLPLQITMDLPGHTSTVHYSHWGDPVQVTAPPLG